MAKRKHTKKQLIQIVTQYGIHIWAILLIANAALVYAYNFATHAATNSDTTLHTLDISQIPSPTSLLSPSPSNSSSPAPSTGPLGPAINLTFTVPGIGSGGGVLKPVHLQRAITVFLFAPDVNSQNTTVKPLYTIQGTAAYDSNPLSPTYTSFISPVFDLGSDVKDGDYQIAFRTDQSLRTIIKQNSTDLGGEIFSLSKDNQILPIPSQTVLMGDIIPDQGDNKVDINDYNAFINCYGNNNMTNSFCKGHNYGDFNDDGAVDGIDYNILLRSLYTLSQEGLSTPKLSPTPASPYRISRLKNPITPTVAVKKVTKPASPSAATNTTKTSGNGGSILSGILFFLFIIILGVIGVVLYLKNENIRNKINAIIHLSPTGTPSTETSATEETPTETQPDVEASTIQTEPAPDSSRIIEKDCYVKKKEPDKTGNGVWLMLTDDNGPLEAHYTKNDAADGFAKVKGVMKTENGKTFLEISEITAEG